MPRPMIVAPTLPRISSAIGVLALTSPPPPPWVSRNVLSETSQSCSASPPTPSGFSTLWFGPATKPSSDIVIVTFTLLIQSSLLRARPSPSTGGCGNGFVCLRNPLLNRWSRQRTRRLGQGETLGATHALGEGLHDRETDLRVLLQRLQERPPLQHHHAHVARRNDRRRARASVDQRHLAEEVARSQDP